MSKRNSTGTITGLPISLEFLTGIALLMEVSFLAYLSFPGVMGRFLFAIGISTIIFFALKVDFRYIDLEETGYFSKAEKNAEDAAYLTCVIFRIQHYINGVLKKLDDKQTYAEQLAKELGVPKRYRKQWYRWRDRWTIIKPLQGKKEPNEILAHIELYHPHLKCKRDTLRKNTRAGEAGLLD